MQIIRKYNMNYVIVSEKSWNRQLADKLSKTFPQHTWALIDKRADFTEEHLVALNPAMVFIPHWSYIIPASIYERFECVVFHMTDLPYGRGGSPLQNLIVRGHKDTKISALRVVGGLDAGDIYLKKDLSLSGTAGEIYLRANDVIEGMIVEIVEKQLQPVPQQGEIVEFKRRKKEESNMGELTTMEQVYDYIRMLDAEGYPHAFIENEHFVFEFTDASVEAVDTITAKVKIRKK